LFYFYRHPEIHPGLPEATIATMEAGAVVTCVTLLMSFFAKSWTRVALLLSSISLLWVFFLIALTP
jgi:hypothetical protein